jgi:hypothetical protein
VWHKTVFDWINQYSGIKEEKEEDTQEILSETGSQQSLVML